MRNDKTMPEVTVMPHSSYSVERLPNGLIRVFSRDSKLSSCFNPDGTYRHGDLRPPIRFSDGIDAEQVTLDDTLLWLDELYRRDEIAQSAKSGNEESTAKHSEAGGQKALRT